MPMPMPMLPQDEDWIQLFRAAIVEMDETKLSERVALAKQAIQKRQQELSSSSDHRDERQKLEDAANMNALAKAWRSQMYLALGWQ